MEKPFKVKPAHIHLSCVPMGVYRHRANPPKGVKYERLLESDCWESVSDKFDMKQPHHQGQIVEIFPDDGAYYAELIALKLSNGEVRMKEISYKSLEKDKTPLANQATASYSVKLRGPKKWSIMRDKDNQVMIDGLATKEEAEERLKAYITEITE